MESSRTTIDDDICIMVGGQGGDGSLTVTALLAGLFRRRGLYVYSSRNVLSRIKGGHADGVVRASRNNIKCLGDHVKVVVAFDEEAVLAAKDDLDPYATIMFSGRIRPDSSGQYSQDLQYPIHKVDLGGDKKGIIQEQC